MSSAENLVVDHLSRIKGHFDSFLLGTISLMRI